MTKIRHTLCSRIGPWAPLLLWRVGLLSACAVGLAMAQEPAAVAGGDPWAVALGAGGPWAVVALIGWRALGVVEHLVRVVERAVDGARDGRMSWTIRHVVEVPED